MTEKQVKNAYISNQIQVSKSFYVAFSFSHVYFPFCLRKYWLSFLFLFQIRLILYSLKGKPI